MSECGQSEPPVLLMAGTARPEPGVTNDMPAERVYTMLRDARDGKASLLAVAQREDGRCRKQFLITATNAGQRSWKHFKKVYSEQIESEETLQQWARGSY